MKIPMLCFSFDPYEENSCISWTNFAEKLIICKELSWEVVCLIPGHLLYASGAAEKEISMDPQNSGPYENVKLIVGRNILNNTLLYSKKILDHLYASR